MQRDVFLVGAGQTRFGEWWQKSLPDLIKESVDAAIANSPVTALDIDLVVVGNMFSERCGGQAQLGAMTAALLPHRPPALRVEAACGSGGLALHTACAMLESGRASTVLVVGAEKMTDVATNEVSAALMGAADAELDADCGLTFPGIFGLIAKRYMHDYGLTREELSLVSVLHHQNAVQNPNAQFRSAVTERAVSGSSPVADPLRLLDCSPVSDGAAAVILSTKHESNKRILASQLATDVVSITQRPSLTSFNATKEAAKKALAEAEITMDDVSDIELHDCFSIAALINVEDLGLAEPGRGITVYRELLERPATTRSRINGSGGLKGCGHPVGATGVKQLIDVSKGLEHRGGGIGLTHNFGGACATCAVHILELVK